MYCAAWGLITKYYILMLIFKLDTRVQVWCLFDQLGRGRSCVGVGWIPFATWRASRLSARATQINTDRALLCGSSTTWLFRVMSVIFANTNKSSNEM